MFSSAFEHITFHGKLVCRDVLHLSSFLPFAKSVLQVLAGDLGFVGWQQAGEGQALSAIRASFGCDMCLLLVTFEYELPSTQGLQELRAFDLCALVIGTAVKEGKCQVLCSVKGPAKAPSDARCANEPHMCFAPTLN